MAGRIFISYRRADTANQAGWLAERLAGHYGRPQVIMDVDSIQLGNDFADVIAAANPGCLIQISAYLKRPVPTVHPVQLIDRALRG